MATNEHQQERFGVSWPARLYMLSLLALIGVIPGLVAGAGVTWFRKSTDTSLWVRVASTGLTLVPLLLVGWAGWRMLTKSATASSQGLVIRSFRRTDRLTWDQVQDIGHHDMTYSRAGGLSFSKVTVVFLEDGRYRARTAAVSFRHAYGDAEALRRWWPGYKPHHVLDFIEPPQVHGVSSGELVGAVRPERSVVIGQMVGLLFVASISGAIAIPILVAGKLSTPPFLVAAVLTAGVTVLCVVAAIRAPLVRLGVTPSDLVIRGLLHTSRLRRSDLLALQTVRRGQWSGWVVMARMRDGTSRPLNASASWGREGVESHLRTIRKRLPSVPVG